MSFPSSFASVSDNPDVPRFFMSSSYRTSSMTFSLRLPTSRPVVEHTPARSAAALPLALPLHQHTPKDLARRGLGDLIHRLQVSDALVAPDPLRYVRQDVIGRRFGAGGPHHVRPGHLARLLVRDRDDRGVGHGGMRQEYAFDHRGGHLVALVLDQLLEAIDDEEVPVLVCMSDVAGVEPAL